jgi:transposase
MPVAPARPDSARATGIKNSRYALWKNPENLTEKQQTKLAWIVQTDPRLARAYYLKEGLRVIFKLPLAEATEALDKWVGWARRCRIPSFVKLQKSIVKHRTAILASIEHGLSNGRVESMNTKIRLMTRIAFGFTSPDALIALAMLSLGGHKPVLPGRD